MKKLLFLPGALVLAMLIVIVSGIRFDLPLEKLKPKYVNGQSRFIAVDGMSVHYRDEGKGFPVLLLHAAPSSLHSFDELARELSRRYRIIRLDLPGYGLTGPNPTGDYSIEWYLRFLDDFLNALHVDSCYAAGNSFGGRLAAELAYKGRVTKLVLISSAGYPIDDEGVVAVKMARSGLLRPIVRYVTPRFFVAMNLRETFGPAQSVSEKTVDRYYDLMLRTGNRDTFIAMCNHKLGDISGHLKSLKVPTLILWGSADSVIPVSYAERFNRDITGSKLIVYEGVGHMPQEVIPEKMEEDMRAFL